MDVHASAGSLSDPPTQPAAPPISPAPAPTTSKVSCDDCGASFSRREHLQRHKRSHTNERPYTCLQCGNAFSRMDVLVKHAESHNQKDFTSSRSSTFPRACVECAQVRIRCSRGLPCQRCGDRGLECTYPTSRKRKASRAAPEPDAVPLGPSPTVAEESDLREEPVVDDRAGDAAQAEQVATSSPAVPVGVPSANGGGVEPSWDIDQASGVQEQQNKEPSIQGQSSSCVVLETPVEAQAIQPMEWFAMNWLSPTGPTGSSAYHNHQTDVNSFQQSEGVYALFDYPFPPTLPPGPQWAWPAPPLDPSGQPAGNEVTASSPLGPVVLDEVEESAASGATAATFYVDGGASRAPFKGLSAQRGVISHEDEDSDTGSPDDHHLHAGHFPKGRLSLGAAENILNGIRSSISLEQIRGGCFPTSHQLQGFFRLYFQYFHPTFPFLQTDSTFYDDDRRWPLALAVCSVGAQYCAQPDSVTTKQFLIDTLHHVVPIHFDNLFGREDTIMTAQSCSSADADALCLWITQAAILHLICQRFSAVQPSFHLTSIDQFKLTQACRRLGLLKRNTPNPNAFVNTPQEVNSQVVEWIKHQSRLRTGYMIWLLDSLLSIDNTSEALMSLGDIDCSLPCRDFVWDNPAGPVIAKEFSQTVDFLDAMEMLYIEKKLPRGLGDFGTIVMIHVIIQRTKAVVKQYQTGLASWVPSASSQKRAPSRRVEETWPPCLPILSRWRNSACDCLDVLHWNANSISARDGGWETFTILHLHLSRLVLLTPVEPLRVLAEGAPSHSSGSAHLSDAVQAAQHMVLKWALEDQYKARLAVIHAGALFWHVRRYSINSFVEPVGVYLATLVLWGYSMASAHNTEAEMTGKDYGNNDQTVHTELGSSRSDLSRNPTPSNMASSMLSPLPDLDEEPEVMQFYVDRPCDDEIVQAYVRYGRRMCGRLSQVGDLCQKDAPRKILIQGQRILEARQRAGRRRSGSESRGSTSGLGSPVVWGTTTRYLRILHDFSSRGAC